jgi:uncharacterized NAD(P)/FAD-binding protein YdhS
MIEKSASTSITIAVIGGGFTGSVFALKALRAMPEARVVVVEQRNTLGRGVAYGDAAPIHLLNVPVARAEAGLQTSFADWLNEEGVDLSDALEESGGDISAAFVRRDLYGTYLEHMIRSAVAISPQLRVLHAQAVRVQIEPSRTVVLDDGRSVNADVVVLATGNFPARPLSLPGLQSDALVVNDPWRPNALSGVDPSWPVMLVGTGLTMIDIAAKLADDGHYGPLVGLSRHGVLPATHASGGSWSPFIGPGHRSPRQVLREVRLALAQAEEQNVPWQRVLDAVRPAAARVWHGWSSRERLQFLRHLQAIWTAARHRMAPCVARRVQSMRDSGQLRIVAGRIQFVESRQNRLNFTIAMRGGGSEMIEVARVINCTGPRGDISAIEHPLFADLRSARLVLPDALDLGIETDDSAVVGAFGEISSWLFALGPLTRPAWWEITAIPEINSQIEHLVQKLATRSDRVPSNWSLLADEFLDLGAGI